MKKFVSIFLAICLAVSCCSFAALGAEGDIEVLLDGVAIAFDQPPVIENGRTLVPMRAIFEALGAEVNWNQETLTATGEKGSTIIALTIGEAAIVINGEKTELDISPVIVNSRTLVPVRAISEAFEANVEWDNDARRVIISTKGEAEELDGNYYRISTADGKYIAVENASAENGAKIVAANFADNDSQLWGATAKGNGEYSFANKNSGLSFDIPASSKDIGKGVTQYTSNGGGNQTLVASVNEDGTYTFAFKHSGLFFTAGERDVTQEEAKDKGQKFTLTFAGESTMKQVKKSEGYLTLDEQTRERFDTYVYETRAYTSSIYTQTSALVESEKYLEKTPAQQQEILKKAMSFVAFNLVYIGEVPNEANITYEITKKEYIPQFDAWRGSIQPAWAHSVKFSDGDTLTMYSTVEETSVIEDSIRAVSRFPKAMRQYLNRLIYRVDDANNYNGGGDTIWIRLNFVPSENAIAQTLAHELGHVLDQKIASVSAKWDEAIAADRVPISGYGNSNRTEDLAEFSRLFHMAKRDDKIMEAVAKVYPNRMSVYRGILYGADKKYYSQFKSDYDKASGFANPNEEAVYSAVTINAKALTATADENGAVLAVEEFTGKDSQLWWIREMTDGNSVLFNKATGFCVNVPGNSTEDGKNLIAWNGGGGDNEKWLIEKVDGGVTLKVKNSGLYLADDNGTAVQSSKAGVWTIETK